MKITIEPEEGEKIKADDPKALQKFTKRIVYEHVFEFCLVGMQVDRFGVKLVRRLHTNREDPFTLIGLLGGAHQELFADALHSSGLPHRHDVDGAVAESTTEERALTSAQTIVEALS